MDSRFTQFISKSLKAEILKRNPKARFITDFRRGQQETKAYIHAMRQICHQDRIQGLCLALCRHAGFDKQKACQALMPAHSYKPEKSGQPFPVHFDGAGFRSRTTGASYIVMLDNVIANGGAFLMLPGPFGLCFIDIDKGVKEANIKFLRQTLGEPLAVLRTRSYFIKKSVQAVYRIDASITAEYKPIAWQMNGEYKGELLHFNKGSYLSWNSPQILANAIKWSSYYPPNKFTISLDDLKKIEIPPGRAKPIAKRNPHRAAGDNQFKPTDKDSWTERQLKRFANAQLLQIRKAQKQSRHDTTLKKAISIYCYLGGFTPEQEIRSEIIDAFHSIKPEEDGERICDDAYSYAKTIGFHKPR